MSNGSVDWGALAAQWAASQRDSVVEPEIPPFTPLNGVPPPGIPGRHHYHPPPEKHFPSTLGYIPPPTPPTEQAILPDTKVPPTNTALFPSTISSEIKNAKPPLPASVTDYGLTEKPPGIDNDDGPPGLVPDSSSAESGTGSAALPPGEEPPPGMEIESTSETAATPVPPPSLSTERSSGTSNSDASSMPHYPPHQYPPQPFPPGPARPPPPGYPQYYPPPYQGGPPPHPSHGFGPPPPQHMTGYAPPPGHRGTPPHQFGGPPYRGGFNRGAFYRGPGGPTGFRHFPPSDPGNSWLTPQNELPGATKGGGLNGDNENEEEQKKKHVPLWIKQELERLEADKAKKAEKEKVRSEASSRRSLDNEHASAENSLTSSSASTRRYFDVPDERYGKYGDRDNRDHRRRSRSRSRSKSSAEIDPVSDMRQRLDDAHRKRSPSPILTEEEREAKLLKRTKIILTEILLAVTNEEIEGVAREVYDRAKRKERPKVREDFRIAYDRSDSESRGSPNKQSESEDSDFDGKPMFRNERISITEREYSRTESQYSRNGTSNSRREPTPPSRQQPEFSRLSPSIRERFEPKEDERSPVRNPERSRDSRDVRDSKFRPEKERVPVISPPPRERTPESQTGKEPPRTSSKSDRKRQRSSRSRSDERRTTVKKPERRGHDSDYDDSYSTKQRYERDRSRTPEKKLPTKTKRRKSRSRSLSDRERSYVEDTVSRSDRKRSSRKDTRDSRSKSRSKTRSPVVSKSEKKLKHKKSSYRDEERSRSRDRSHDDDRYSDDYDRDSSSRKSKKKKKK